MAKQASPDRAYLIRCWQEQNTAPDARHWRFSIEEVLHNGKRQGFPDLASLLAFLQTELDSPHNTLDQPQDTTDKPHSSKGGT